MGYTTKFDGTFTLDKPLFDSQMLYLLEFAGTRRVKRNVVLLESVLDSARVAVGLPLGKDGGYFVNQKWDEEHGWVSVIDYNLPASTQPSLWCHWIPTSDGRGIQWDGEEKFYHYNAWLQYLIVHFLKPWGYLVNGSVKWIGEDCSDVGQIKVENNTILLPAGRDFLKEVASPIPVSLNVLQGLEAVAAVGANLHSWVNAVTAAETLVQQGGNKATIK